MSESALWIIWPTSAELPVADGASQLSGNEMSIKSAAGGVDVEMLKKAVKLVKGKFETEASGSVTLSTVRKIAETGVTFISCGALTHSVVAMDISLKIKLLNTSGQ